MDDHVSNTFEGNSALDRAVREITKHEFSIEWHLTSSEEEEID